MADLSFRDVACVDGLDIALQAPKGDTFALVAATDTGTDVTWIDATTGAIRATRRGLVLDRAEKEQIFLDDHGRLVAIGTDWSSLIAVDLSTGRVAELAAGDDAFFEGARATRSVGDSIIVLRRQPNSIEVVRVDLAALLR